MKSNFDIEKLLCITKSYLMLSDLVSKMLI